MITDTEIKTKGIQILAKHLGYVEMERFVAILQREPFDYTEWRRSLPEGKSVSEMSHQAAALREGE